MEDSDFLDCYMPEDANWVGERYVNGVLVGAPVQFDDNLVTYSLYENTERVPAPEDHGGDGPGGAGGEELLVAPGRRIGFFEFGTNEREPGHETHAKCLERYGKIDLYADNPDCPPPILFDVDAVFPVLRRAGYATAFFGKIHNGQSGWLCSPENHSEPFDHFETECQPCG